MRSYISYDELEELGETIVRAYINKTRRYNALCVDIEGLVTDYLGLTVVYETIVEDDLNKIAFLSNGKRPLRVVRDGKRVEVIFPKNTVVLDKVLLNEKESSRRRFTLGHEGAHSIIAKQNPMQDVGCFHNTFDPERQYTLEERRELLSFSEAQADRLSSVFLMPRFILEKVMKKYKCENGIPVYGWNVFAPEDKITLRKMADCMGATKTAVFLSKTAVFFGPMAKFRRCRRSCVVICLRISYNHAMGRETGRATGGRLLSGTDQRHRFPVRISGRRYAGGGHAAVRLEAPVGAGVCLYLRGNGRAFVGR